MIHKIIQLLYLLFISLLLSEQTPTEIEDKIELQKDKMEDLEKEILTLTQKIKNKDSEGKTTVEKLSMIGKKIDLAEELIQTLKKDENQLNSLASETKIKLSLKEKELNQIKQKALNMITYLYKNKKNNYLDVLVGSENWNDLVYKIKYLEVLSTKQQEINNDINDIIEELDNDISYFTNQIIDNKNAQLNKKDALAELIINEEKNKIKLDNIQSEKFELEKINSEKKEMIIQINKMLEKLYVDKEAAEERENELERIRKAKEKEKVDIDIEYFHKNKGKLPWPTPGSIVSRFGEFSNNGVKTSNIGIEIKTKKNAEIKTVYDGIVVEIGFNPYYGSFIWVDHGGGFSTIYANLNENNIFVEKQEYIESNTVIGQVQNVENDSHGILNFMLWGSKGKDKDGNYILSNENPEDWIK